MTFLVGCVEMNAELFEAVERDDKLPVLRFLEKEGDVNTRDEYGVYVVIMCALNASLNCTSFDVNRIRLF